jgi:hypothetical protein
MHYSTKFTQKFAAIQENDLHKIKAMTNIQIRMDTQDADNLIVGGFLPDTKYLEMSRKLNTAYNQQVTADDHYKESAKKQKTGCHMFLLLIDIILIKL